MYRVVTISPFGSGISACHQPFPDPINDRRMVFAEPVQAEHLVVFVRYQPQPARCSFLHFAPPGVGRFLPSDEARDGQPGRPVAA